MSSDTTFKLPSLQRLQSAEQNELLDVIDSLRSQGMGDFISLPQLIVCGDQSSGKSSVLEALSGIPFPQQETLCTRFATEVILRKSKSTRILASIVAERNRAASEIVRFKEFQHELKNQDDFDKLFERAGEAMGVSASGKSFSKDTLRVEISGPSHPQLTLVDLPGLIHAATKTQTDADVLLVHDLVDQYLRSPRSIILAVVSAKNDIGNQIILKRARTFDSKGQRTLGIITKPDTLTRGSKNEEAFIALARNEDVSFDLGWHVVKNIDSANSNSASESRDAQETQYFETSHFNRLPSHTLGISFLRSRLSKVLFNQIRTELPKLLTEIETKITSTKDVNAKLGPSRAEPEKQREYLISLSQSFQAICRDAVRGNYEHEFFQGSEAERRLCANLMNKHFQFATKMQKYGATWNIVEEKDKDGEGRTRDEAIKEACKLLKRSRGRELPGLPNPALVGELFRQYSKPWKTLAQAHIKDIWDTTNRFLELLLRHLTDDDSSEKIQRHWLFPKMEEKLNLAQEKLGELLAVHEDQPMTTNTRFLKRNRAHQQKIDKTVIQKIKNGDFQDIEEAEIARALSTLATNQETDMDMLAAEEALDNMMAFYDVASTLFKDNLPNLAVQLPIVRGLPEILCPTAVFSMDLKTIHSMAGESEEKVSERTEIERKLRVLEDGGRICKQYARRAQIYPSNIVDNMVELSGDSSSPSLEEATNPDQTKAAGVSGLFQGALPFTSNPVLKSGASPRGTTFKGRQVSTTSFSAPRASGSPYLANSVFADHKLQDTQLFADFGVPKTISTETDAKPAPTFWFPQTVSPEKTDHVNSASASAFGSTKSQSFDKKAEDLPLGKGLFLGGEQIAAKSPSLAFGSSTSNGLSRPTTPNNQEQVLSTSTSKSTTFGGPPPTTKTTVLPSTESEFGALKY